MHQIVDKCQMVENSMLMDQPSKHETKTVEKRMQNE